METSVQTDLIRDIPFRSKETSWLSFNSRVLQEAEDPTVPLLERMRFLGIYSSNLDEFFRVRVATLQRLVLIKDKYKKLDILDPSVTLKEVNQLLATETGRFNKAYQEVMKGLKSKGIEMVNEETLPEDAHVFVKDFYDRKMRPRIMPLMLKATLQLSSLRDNTMYLAVRLSKANGKGRPAHALIEIPSDLPRFIVLPQSGKKRAIIYLDDIIRYHLADIFRSLPYNQYESYAVKFTRDAALEVDDDITESLYEKVAEGLRAREVGLPVRINYDADIPSNFLQLLTRTLNLGGGNSRFPGARYHNRRDLMSFPSLNRKDLEYPAFTPSPHRHLRKAKKGYFKAIRKRDILLHFPYQSFNYFLDLLREAIIDPYVQSIAITQYRLAKNSCVARALLSAAKAGKNVTVMVEPTARFDEEANIAWAEEFQKAGIHVILGVQGLKVHAKLCLITRRESSRDKYYSVIGTGNFNEDTSRVYTDHMLWTANQEIGEDVSQVFKFFTRSYREPKLRHLMCSPFHVRPGILQLMENEIKNCRAGKPSGITVKINNLADPEMVEQLYRASREGVPVRLVVRSMFSVVTEEEGFSENIEAFGIVDRFLEHTRFFIFENGGDPSYYLSSADLLPRNLDRRIEVVCPLFESSIKKEIQKYIDFQFADNSKARVLDRTLSNKKVRGQGSGKKIAKKRGQGLIQEHLAKKV